MGLKVACPYCQYEMSLATPKAGRFKPTCKKCQQSFQLTISQAPGSSSEFIGEAVPLPGVTPNPNLETRLDTAPTSPAATAKTSSTAASKPSVTHTENEAVDQTLAVSEQDRVEQAAAAQVLASAGTRGDASNSTRTDASASASSAESAGRLGGYRLIKELGRGGMGSVYLAKQLSLGRQVAIKTIRGKWASNPRAIARFIREAYAAAQLVHHNVVQIYDLDEDKGTNFFSMELVTGGSVDQLIKQEGKLDPRRAATLVIQAARGLKFAHDHGMVHRDVKPANLMLNAEGMVKVADLGLVKTPSMTAEDDAAGDSNPLLTSANSNVTGAGSRMGTPAYMAPEQATDATNVDPRADIYSLGCTFYAMVVGNPPYSSKTVEEMITKHKSEPMVRPEKLVATVPKEVGDIIERMTAKRAADRYQTMDEVITALEKFLASSPNQSSTRKAQLKQLEEAAKDFRKVPAGLVRMGIVGLFAAVSVVVTLIGFLISWRFGLSGLLFAAATPAAALGLSMMTDGDQPVASRLRLLFRSAKLMDLVTGFVGLILFVAVVWVLGMWLGAIIALVGALVVAFVGRAMLSTVIDQGRRAAVERAESVLKELRIEGVDEDKVRGFLIEAAGKQWQELYEAVFDYEAMQAKRSEMAEASGKLPSSARPWRDSFVARLETRAQKIKAAKDRQVLQKVEQASLRAQGKSMAEAAKEAAQVAAALVEMADETRTTLSLMKRSLPESEAFARRAKIKQMLADARGGRPKPELDEPSQGVQGILGSFLGGRVRFAVGAMMIVGCVLWLKQNNLLDQTKLDEIAASAQQQLQSASSTIQSGDIEAIKEAGQATAAQSSQVIGETQALSLPVVGPFFHSIFSGLLGVMIVISSIRGGWRWTPIAIVAAILTMGLPLWGLPSFGIPSGANVIAFLIGSVILATGLFLND